MAVTLQRVDEANLEGLLLAAVAGAEPGETMPLVSGPPGWTAQRRAAFRSYHRDRFGGLDGPHAELTFAVVVDGQPVGVARLARVEDPQALEAGVWLTRAARGRGVGGDVLRLLQTEAARAGASVVLAETTPDNTAALRLLRGRGASLGAPDAEGHVGAELPVAGAT